MNKCTHISVPTTVFLNCLQQTNAKCAFARFNEIYRGNFTRAYVI